jgi:hypothetical protein
LSGLPFSRITIVETDHDIGGPALITILASASYQFGISDFDDDYSDGYNMPTSMLLAVFIDKFNDGSDTECEQGSMFMIGKRKQTSDSNRVRMARKLPVEIIHEKTLVDKNDFSFCSCDE